MLKRIGLTPGKKLLVFLISLVALTIPFAYVYNSIAVLFFVLLSLLSARRQNFSYSLVLVLPVALFVLMSLSTLWSVDVRTSFKALSKESALIFIPLAFMVNHALAKRSVNDILKNYSLGMCAICLFLVGRAIYRFSETGNTEVFFYHELATPEINAIYLSVLASLALMFFVAKKGKRTMGYVAMIFMLVFVFLLSSKNVILVDIFLILAYYIFYSGFSRKAIVTAVAGFTALFLVLGYYGKIHERFTHELEPVENNAANNGVHFVTIGEALSRTEFNHNCYFNGTAFRVYQVRIFFEMLSEDPVFFTGYGINTSKIMIARKAAEHKLLSHTEGGVAYSEMNYHNQYIESFADLGIFGFVITVAMLLLNLKKAFKGKYFAHIAFSLLMISVFLTESFLWRQRGVVFFTLFYCLFNDMQPFIKKPKVKKLPQESSVTAS